MSKGSGDAAQAEDSLYGMKNDYQTRMYTRSGQDGTGRSKANDVQSREEHQVRCRDGKMSNERAVCHPAQ